jgi:hypothetical protein
MISTALAHIQIGVVVERRKSRSAWADILWRPVLVFGGRPAANSWTWLSGDDDRSLFYAGEAIIELHRTEASNYRDNLISGRPSVWVNMYPTASEPEYELRAVTVDPAEGEAFTDAGSNLVEAVSMPSEVAEIVRRFVAEHYIERPFVKRARSQQSTISRD